MSVPKRETSRPSVSCGRWLGALQSVGVEPTIFLLTSLCCTTRPLRLHAVVTHTGCTRILQKKETKLSSRTQGSVPQSFHRHRRQLYFGGSVHSPGIMHTGLAVPLYTILSISLRGLVCLESAGPPLLTLVIVDPCSLLRTAIC